MKARLTKKSVVICKGNARRFGLRPSGRRNALGSILTKRTCKWVSGCSPTMALLFRCNTHTAPNYRVPITEETHDKECTANCLAQDKPVVFSLCPRGGSYSKKVSSLPLIIFILDSYKYIYRFINFASSHTKHTLVRFPSIHL